MSLWTAHEAAQAEEGRRSLVEAAGALPRWFTAAQGQIALDDRTEGAEQIAGRRPDEQANAEAHRLWLVVSARNLAEADQPIGRRLRNSVAVELLRPEVIPGPAMIAWGGDAWTPEKAVRFALAAALAALEQDLLLRLQVGEHRPSLVREVARPVR